MIDDLRDMIAPVCRGATAFAGVGNADRGDDGAGIVLARRLASAGVPFVWDCGATPERAVAQLRGGGFDSVVFLDAADFGAAPGAVAVFDACEIAGRFPQISTHKLSLGTVARLVAGGSACRVWLIGVQPRSIDMNGATLSAPVNTTVNLLAHCLAELTAANSPALRERVCL